MTNTYETLVGCFYSFPTINKAIAAGHTNIRVATDVEENETIYIKEPINISIDKNIRVHFSQKNALIIDGGSLLIRGSACDEDVRNHESTISCCEDCMLISPLISGSDDGNIGTCDSILIDLRIESPGTVIVSGSRMTIDHNYFLCPLTVESVHNSSISHNGLWELTMGSVSNTFISSNTCSREGEESGKNIKRAY